MAGRVGKGKWMGACRDLEVLGKGHAADAVQRKASCSVTVYLRSLLHFVLSFQGWPLLSHIRHIVCPDSGWYVSGGHS